MTNCTRLIGRNSELTTITNLLADPACRLLTIVGQGGAGKTRLVLTLAESVDFADGVTFVPLQAVASLKSNAYSK